MNEKLDFSKRYHVGHGTSTYCTFDTVEELNAWFDAQDSEGKYFCRLYDIVKHTDILGSTYMWLPREGRWKDENDGTQINCNFDYNDCYVTIRFLKQDKFGADRHQVMVYKRMCKTLTDYCFKKTEPEIIQFAKDLTAFQTCTCD